MSEAVIFLMIYLIKFMFQKNWRFKSKRFNMIKEINESKTIYISCECKCKFDCRKCNSNQKWNNDNRRSECSV